MSRLSRAEARIRRHRRVRKKVFGTPERPRLCVFRSLKEIYAQVIDDEAGHTLVAASSIDHELREKLQGMTKTEKARLVGELVAVGPLRRAFDRLYSTAAASSILAGLRH